MYCCLSSAKTIQYKYDVLRVLGLPRGSIVQFRYRLNLVPEEFLEKLTSSKTNDRNNLLIAFYDGKSPDSDGDILPCRFGVINSAKIYGSVLVVSIILTDYCTLPENIMQFGRNLRASGNPPLRPDPEDAETGVLWTQLPDTSIVASSSSGREAEDLAWENIISELAKREDYKDVPMFFRISEIINTANNDSIQCISGIITLKSDAEYSVNILHLSPGSYDHNRRIEFIPPHNLGISTSPTRVSVDSGYDVKELIFRTNNSRRERAQEEFMYVVGDATSETPVRYALRVRVKSNLLKMIARVSLFALALLLADGAQESMIAGDIIFYLIAAVIALYDSPWSS
ncbi:hypothetical protein ACFL3H_05405 [Gemmatimonadota bacterium]